MAVWRSPAIFALVCVGSAVAQVNLNQAQFEPEVAQRDQFSPDAFSFSFPKFAANGAAGSIRNMDLSSNPFLGTLPHGGLAQFEDVFSACTINVPHAHPRGNEIYYVIDGVLEWGIQEESGGRFSTGNLTSGQLVVVPQGLLHYVYNPSCSTTKLLQFWDNADFGTVVMYANMVNNFPTEVFNAFSGLNAAEISALKQAVPKPTAPINQGSICLQRCGGAPAPAQGYPPASPPASQPAAAPTSPTPTPSPKSSPSPSPSNSNSNSNAVSSTPLSVSTTNGTPAVANVATSDGTPAVADATSTSG